MPGRNMAALGWADQVRGHDLVPKSCKFLSEVMLNKLFENKFKI